jgi:SAM-dependent methyltransferase
MNKYFQTNKELWDAWTAVNAASELYDLEGFKKGTCSLLDIEVEEVGDVNGKNLLHLQCHFGMDTLSWARRGAKVTGIDFSGEAIRLARSLSQELNIPAYSVNCNIYNLPDYLSEKFDIVFTSGGAINWLPDLKRWAEIIAHFLKPNGFFYIREFHPVEYMFDDSKEKLIPTLRYPYFYSDEPIYCENEGNYANVDSKIKSINYEWSHHLGEIITSLIDAGLCIEFLHEFPFITYKSHPFLVQGEDGFWRYPELKGGLPLMFSVKAIKQDK